MKILVNVVDKIIFAAVFVAALQIPILADHYRQYLSGAYDTRVQTVNEYRTLARQFGYSDVEAMVKALQKNEDALVREDARNKAGQLAQLDELRSGLATLQQGNYFEQAWYMFQPARYTTLRQVARNFSPSVPLVPAAVGFSLVLAILVNLLLWSPALCVKGVRRLRKKPIRFAHRH